MKYLIKLFLLLLVSQVAIASNAAIKQANDLLKQRDYNAALQLLSESFESLDENGKVQARLIMGIASYNNALLYDRLQDEAIKSQLSYYGKLAKRNRKERSIYSFLYLGQVYLAKDYYGKAMRNLTRFLRKKNTSEKQKQLAMIDKAVVLNQFKRKKEALRLLKGVKSKDAEIVSHTIVARIKMGYKIKGLQQKLKMLEKSPNLSARTVSNILFLYNHLNMSASSLAIKEVLDQPVYVETKAGKVLNFYDPTIMANLSKYYLLEAIRNLTEANKQPKNAPIASYYLAKSYLQARNYKDLGKMAQEVKQSHVPTNFKLTANILEEVANSKGKKSANTPISGLVKKHAENNKVLENALLACIHVGASCTPVLHKAMEHVKQGSGLKYSELNFALGQYFIARKKFDVALEYLEAARDKSKKNRIDANDPLLLVNLAQAYRQTRVFSENLEIYFEMSKYYPVVRQIQDAVQGIYSMEQRSAGDVKIL